MQDCVFACVCVCVIKNPFDKTMTFVFGGYWNSAGRFCTEDF